MQTFKEEVRNIAQSFSELSHDLQVYRFKNWTSLTHDQRQEIEDAEWDLHNYSSVILTRSVGNKLKAMQNDLQKIADATATARKAIATIRTIKDIISITAAFVVLGGAIASQNPLAITGAASDLLKVAHGAINK